MSTRFWLAFWRSASKYSSSREEPQGRRVVGSPANPIDLSQEMKAGTLQRRSQREVKAELRTVIALWLGATFAWADSLELKKGTLIEGKFIEGAESEISFQIVSTVQKYNRADIVSFKFDSGGATSYQPKPSTSSLPSEPQPAEHAGIETPAYVTIRQERVSSCAPSMKSIPSRNRWAIDSRPRSKNRCAWTATR